MSTYRQTRRQTRRARKAGLQPIVVIDSPFPVPAGVLLARWAWRYRSEIAPATTAGALLLAGWWSPPQPPPPHPAAPAPPGGLVAPPRSR
jgi:hypothetical protein